VADTLLDIRNLRVEFPSREQSAGSSAQGSRKNLVAVRDLSFTIAPREVLGLVGESGSGKSITSLAVMRLLPTQARSSGQVYFDFSKNGTPQPRNLLESSEDEVRSLRGSQIGMIFQEPMTALNPVMRVGDQIAEAVRAHASRAEPVGRAEAWERAVQSMEEVAIPDFERRARDYPHQLSGGMRQRIMIAMAIVNRPKLLIADEPTTALDVTIQAQILELLAGLRERFGLAMLFISHDLAVVSQVADRVAVMYAGSLLEMGTRKDIFIAAAHPYTQGLLKAVPTLATERDRPLQTIEGTVPAPHAIPAGCPFEPRCDFRIQECAEEMPPLVEIAPGHIARCPVVNRA
jgi:peptide/nickel transport system ATP-binding protein